jgi:O-acetyl-ADP-ribose deacetylase (regulator of RNase III)
MVKEVYGDLLKQPDVDIIAHQTNCAGVMGAGIALQIKSQLLPSVEYRKYVEKCKMYGSDLLGQTQLLEAPDGRIVANCFGENIPTGKGKDTDYDALMHSIAKVRNFARMNSMTVGVPGLMGCGIAGGDWKIVRDMLYKLFGSKDEPQLTICYYDKKEFQRWNPNRN